MITIRTANRDDAAALRPLLAELGYEISMERLASSLTALATSAADRVFVALLGEETVACIGCHAIELLHRGRLGRITLLVVAPAHQRSAVGSRLLTEAEHYFREGGCARIEVTSAAHRAGAHAFYLRRGFEEITKRFIKDLPT